MQDSNLRPPVCKTDALPTELIALISTLINDQNCNRKYQESQRTYTGYPYKDNFLLCFATYQSNSSAKKRSLDGDYSPFRLSCNYFSISCS